MDNENTQLSDINVGELNFQPMPKRFMVWDEKGCKFVRGINGHILNWREIANLVEPTIWDCAVELDEVAERFTIVQSTNLFDKNGKEIFEGSILREPDDSISVVQYDGDEGMYRTKCENVLDDMVCGGEYFEVIGHILSNPELVEENK